MPVHNEKRLFEEIASGSERALRLLYDRYFNTLYNYVLKTLKDEGIAKEVVQDVFLKIWENRDSLANVDAPQAYIYAITRNKALDYFRRLVKDAQLADIVEESNLKSPHAADDRMNVSDLKGLILEALNKLSDQKQKVFKMSRYEDFSHDEIADQLNLSKSTIKNHLSETLRYLKEQLKLTSN
ncbi:RNA polymerase sigma-70 factor [Mucilaginibacter sp. RS28]|uniref:RNA polymerase sigma-70 factor n=1 Tax=Mucilaginibacter straminoryzae TaxID=2932774 RepID=A0A9X1X247_9SPHI|nr:RNA polymerase sigma-70 factor [Mucilaginibacter straminoryzae]